MYDPDGRQSNSSGRYTIRETITGTESGSDGNITLEKHTFTATPVRSDSVEAETGSNLESDDPDLAFMMWEPNLGPSLPTGGEGAPRKSGREALGIPTPKLGGAGAAVANLALTEDEVADQGLWESAKQYVAESPLIQRLGGAAVGTLESIVPAGVFSGLVPGPSKHFEEGRGVAHVFIGTKQLIEGVELGLVGVAASETGVGVLVAGAGASTALWGEANVTVGLGILDRAHSMRDPDASDGGGEVNDRKAAKALEREKKRAKKALRTNKEFRRWFHREYKGSQKIPGGGRHNPDLSDRQILEAFQEWQSLQR